MMKYKLRKIRGSWIPSDELPNSILQTLIDLFDDIDRD